MPDDTYSIKEFIGHYMEDMKGQVNEIHTDVKEIKIQTQKTNGRVSKLEFWKSVLIWSFGVFMTLFVSFAYPVMVLIKKEIQNTVVSVLSGYNIVIK